jgi:hypothetical protein
MVSVGWAWTFGRYSSPYAPEEQDAGVRKAGVHGHRYAGVGVAGAATVLAGQRQRDIASARRAGAVWGRTQDTRNAAQVRWPSVQ